MQRGLSGIFLILGAVVIITGVSGFVYFQQYFKNSNYSNRQPTNKFVFLQFLDKILRKSPIYTKIASGHYRDKFFVRFACNSEVRLREGKLVSLNNTDLSGLNKMLSQFTVKIERAYSRRSEEEIARVPQPCQMDQNLAYIFKVPPEQDNQKFIDLLNGLSIVEVAEPIPIVINP